MVNHTTSTGELVHALRAVADKILDGGSSLSWPVGLHLIVSTKPSYIEMDDDMACAAVAELARILGLAEPAFVEQGGKYTHFRAIDNGDITLTAQAYVRAPATELDAAKARIKELEAELTAKFTAPPAALAAEFPAELTPSPECDSALIPINGGPIEKCVKPFGHAAPHQNAEGQRWSDPLDDDTDGEVTR